MKKVLIITYYWPPSGGSGVQRWLKFVKYLPSYQWEPHVFTPENPAFAIKDPSLEKEVPVEAEVMRFPIWEPYDIFLKLSGWFGSGKQTLSTSHVPAKKKSMFQEISTWIRGNLFIPDPRVFWVKPSVKFLAEYIKENGIHIVITTGPPHSVHLIGLKLKKRFPHLRWLADFRDPWTEWGIWESLMVSGPIRRVHKRLERRVLTNADEIITITPFYVKRFEKLALRPVRLVTNGFDEEDFRSVVATRSENFLIRHVGIINEKCDPRPFMTALKNELKSAPDFAKDVRLEFIGEVHPDFKTFVAGDPQLQSVTEFAGNISHDKLLATYGSSSLFLLILTGYKDAEGFMPGKLFEYLATGVPVLGVGPVGGDAADLLTVSGGGIMVASEDTNAIVMALRNAYQEWRNGVRPKPIMRELVKQYSRRAVTGTLVEVLQQQLNKGTASTQ